MKTHRNMKGMGKNRGGRLVWQDQGEGGAEWWGMRKKHWEGRLEKLTETWGHWGAGWRRVRKPEPLAQT